MHTSCLIPDTSRGVLIENLICFHWPSIEIPLRSCCPYTWEEARSTCGTVEERHLVEFDQGYSLYLITKGGSWLNKPVFAQAVTHLLPIVAPLQTPLAFSTGAHVIKLLTEKKYVGHLYENLTS